MIDETWLKLKDKWDLKPGKSKKVELELRVPDNAVPGASYEEVVFLDGGAGIFPEECRGSMMALLSLVAS